MSFNLEGTINQLRLEICRLQPTKEAMMACQEECKDRMHDDTLDGFYIAMILFGVFLIGYIVGKY